MSLDDFYKKASLLMLLCILVLAIMLKKSCNSQNKAIELTNSINDILHTFIDKNGVQNAYISVLQGDKEKDLLRIKSKDSSIVWLQEVVKYFKGKLNSAIIIGNSTNSIGASGTILSRYDTIYESDHIFIYPEYKTDWNNKWEVGSIIASRDSIFRDIKIKNDYEITLGSESNGWFKKREYNVRVKNLNPNTYTEELRSFQIKDKPKRISLGVQLGYGVDLETLKPVKFAGIGINYNILGIK